MNTKLNLGKIFFMILPLALSAMIAMEEAVKETILDKQIREPLAGATMQVAGTTQGVVANLDGKRK